MAVNDSNFRIAFSGSTAVSGAAVHDFYGGTFTGLSVLNASEVVIIQYAASTGLGGIGVSGTGLQGNIVGLMVTPSLIYEMKPMLRSDASQLFITRQGTNSPVIFWTVWARRPL